MTLLFLLSALLSALTGVGGAARVPQAATAQVASVGQDPAARAQVRSFRPALVLPVPHMVAAVPDLIAVAAAVVADEPIYAGRRRE